MIKSWSEIQSRYDAIKDHKPRATKKLNELGDILSSAYAQDPDEADSMWQYIVDLNVADDITFSKFYIAQVFNKLTDRMKPEEATAFLTMTPERVQLMINYGYDGGTLWHCLNTLIKGYLIAGDVDNAITCIGYFYDKFGGMNSGSSEIMEVVRSAGKVCAELKDSNEDEVTSFLDELGSTGNYSIDTFVSIVKAINGIEEPDDYDELFDVAREERYAVEFFDLLWAARDEYDLDDLRDKWVEYIEDIDETEVMPWNYIRDDSDEYEDSKLKFYVDLEKEADELLERYFSRFSLYDVEEDVVWSWIENGDWDRFTKYLSMTLMNTSGDSFDYSSLKRTLDEFMRASMYDDSCDSTDGYDRSYRDLMKGKKKAFADALAKISAIAVGCEAQEDYHIFIKDYIQKASGNVDALQQAGFNDTVETRSAFERLKEYVREFLQSGELTHNAFNTSYRSIQSAMNDEINKNYDYRKNADRDYEYACDDEIAEFYFQHSPQEHHERTSMLSACIKKNDINRAIELIDMMADTEDNPGYDELNGWGRQNMLAIKYLIDEYEYKDEDDWRSEGITDDMREVAKQLVYRMMPHLPEKSQEELKADLYKIDPKDEDTDEYITQLLEDAVVYSTFPKPRGKGGAPNINRMSDEFIHCFERLSKMGRLDVVAEIMSKFAAVRDVLKPVTFDSWMSFMARGLRSGDMIKIYRYNKDIFEAWLENDNLRDWDIRHVAEGFANGCTRQEFMEFRNLVISHKGKVEGLDSCFEATSENTETQLLFDGQTLKLSLDFVEVMGSDPVSNIELHFLSVAKCADLDSVRLLKCEINGIETEDCGFISEMDEDPIIGYNIFRVNEEVDDELTVYSDFFEDNDIDEVRSIVLSLVVMNEDVEPIEEMTDIVIELDDSTGEYKVRQQAESTSCTADFSKEEDDSDGISIDIGGYLKQALANSLGISLDDEEDADEDDDDSDEEIIESDSDDFSDITIYDEGFSGVLVDFCGVEFDEDDETVTLSIWCRNHTDEKRKFWIDGLKIDGDSQSIKSLGTVNNDETDYCNFTISDIDYYSVETIGFEVEVDDMDNKELGRSKHVSLTLDTSDETFSVKITGNASCPDEIDDEDEDDDEGEEDFEDITIYEENDVQVDFCGVEFDEDNEKITLSIWCDSSCDEGRNFWIDDVEVNGISHGSIEKLGYLDEYESEYFEFDIEDVDDVDYEDIRAIEFIVEVDDEDNEELGRAKKVFLSIDIENESFRARVSEIDDEDDADDDIELELDEDEEDDDQ